MKNRISAIVFLLILLNPYFGVPQFGSCLNTNENLSVIIESNTGNINDPILIGDLLVYQIRGNIFQLNIPSGEITQITNNEKKNILRGVTSKYYLIELVDKQGNYHQGDVFLYNRLSGSFQKISNSTTWLSYEPFIDDEYIVWHKDKDEFAIHEISSNTTKTIYCQGDEIDDLYRKGDFIVWQGFSEKDPEIFLYSINSDQQIQITHNEINDFFPVVTEKYLIWQQKNPYRVIVHNFDTGNETVIDSGYIGGRVTVKEEIVTWSSYVNGSREIFTYNMTKQELCKITNNSYDDFLPFFATNKIFWGASYDVWSADIFSYSFETNTISQITESNGVAYIYDVNEDYLAIRDYSFRSVDLILMFLYPYKTPNSDANQATNYDYYWFIEAYLRYTYSGVVDHSCDVDGNQRIESNDGAIIKSSISMETPSVSTAIEYLKNMLGEEYYEAYIDEDSIYCMYKLFSDDSWKSMVQFNYVNRLGENSTNSQIIIYLDDEDSIIETGAIPHSDNYQPYLISREDARRIALEDSGVEAPARVDVGFSYVNNTRHPFDRYLWVVQVKEYPSEFNGNNYMVFIDPNTGHVVDSIKSSFSIIT